MSSNGYLFYRGPSVLDGFPILGILTGTRRPTRNRKIGPMLQTWILRADYNPLRAATSGADRAVCGTCPLRGGTCYVVLKNAPLTVWKARRRYPVLPDDASGILPPLPLRMGAYGDPAAIPKLVWTRLLAAVPGWTGYTHQWRRLEAQWLKRYCMASVDTEAERAEAERRGWRTFRVRERAGAVLPGELVCPASKEAGHRTTCARCRLCDGRKAENRRRSIVIIRH